MIDDHFTPDEQALIEQLQNAPQPALKPAAFDAIRQRMFEAMDNPLPPQPSQPGSMNLPSPVFIALVVGLIGLTVVIIALVVVLLGRMPASPVPPTPSQIPAQLVTVSPAVTATTSQLVTTIQPGSTISASNTPDNTPTSTPLLTATANPTTIVPVPTEEVLPAPPQDGIVVIEGPVSDIQVNVITIYDLEIVLDPNDPLLTVIQIGDEIRVEGVLQENEGAIVVLAVMVFVVNVEVFTGDDGQVWRDSGDCNNPPPDWAPANGWRRRCEGGGGNNAAGNGQSGNPGRGNGRGRNDDDDD